ncbi:MAG: hypothetical protein CM1200mP36_11470 [Gammaproteobacteria bacterium]|nr:MAG: hypothetical protein CM1200mP36_11470 [Gammaproteobacteria bacterium]
MTGGTVPLAATVATRRVYDAFLSDHYEHALMQGPTFCGNPLACAAANASLDLSSRNHGLPKQLPLNPKLTEGLAGCRELPGVRDVRVKGAIGVVQ